MDFNEAMKIPFLDEVPGNAAAYVKLNENVSEVKEWSEDDWIAARIMYYMTVSNPAPAWLHDVHKNRCKFNINKTYKFLSKLLEKSTICEDC